MIIVDSRAGSKKLLDCPVLDGRCVEGTLEFGDAMLTGHGPDASTISVGVELKSVPDLLSSISTGRLGGHQIPGMLRTYDYSFLLFFGEIRRGPYPDHHLHVRGWKNNKPCWRTFRLGRRPVPWAFLQAALMTYTMQSPLRVVHVSDIHDAAAWLVMAQGWLDKPWDKHRALKTFDKSREQTGLPGQDPVEAQIAKTAASLPGIDWVRGNAAAQHFDSIYDMITAEEDAWRMIHGIGPILARSAVQASRRRKSGT